MRIIEGNIFTSQHQTMVNTINCVGIMGAGIALEYKFRYPKMFSMYVDLCKKHQISIGTLWLYKSSLSRWILNFPTKFHWKDKTQPEYLEKGLNKFLSTYKQRGISSIAFPVLGAQNGGLPEDVALEIMQRHLQSCDIPVDIYKYDPHAFDDLYVEFKTKMLSLTNEELKEQSGLRTQYLDRIRTALDNPEIHSLSRLASIKGIGLVSLEKVFAFIMPTSEIEVNATGVSVLDSSTYSDNLSKPDSVQEELFGGYAKSKKKTHKRKRRLTTKSTTLPRS